MESLLDRRRIYANELVIISSVKYDEDEDDDDTPLLLHKMMGYVERRCCSSGPGCYEVMEMGNGTTSAALRPGSSPTSTSNLSGTTSSPPSSQCHHYITPRNNLCIEKYINSSKRFLVEMPVAKRPKKGNILRKKMMMSF